MSAYSLTIFRVRGISIQLHWSLLLALPFLVFGGTYQFQAVAHSLGVPASRMGLPPLAWGLVLAVGLIASIVLHELAHAFVGLRSGARIRTITLMMLGGVTRMETEVRPEREAWMALVGPLASLGLAAISYAAYRLVPMPEALVAATLVFSFMNLMLAGFNLLPAFPMDGGRIVRGLLSRRLGRRRATKIAAGLGRVMAVGFGLLGLLSFNVILVLVAVFVYASASAEERHIATRESLHGLTIAELMTDRLGEVRPSDPVADAARRLLGERAVGARVVEAGAPAPRSHGVVTVRDLARVAEAGRPDAEVDQVVRADLPVVHPGDDAAGLLDQLAASEAETAVVVDANENVVGLVTPAEIERALLLGSLARRGGES